MHRLLGLSALSMGISSVQSGLRLYFERFQTTSMVKYYWIYEFIFFGNLAILKVWVLVEERKAQRGVLEAVSTRGPTGSGKDEAPGPGTSGGLSQLIRSASLPLPASVIPLSPEFSAVLSSVYHVFCCCVKTAGIIMESVLLLLSHRRIRKK
jgi:hypothetical protein